MLTNFASPRKHSLPWTNFCMMMIRLTLGKHFHMWLFANKQLIDFLTLASLPYNFFGFSQDGEGSFPKGIFLSHFRLPTLSLMMFISFNTTAIFSAPTLCTN